MRPLRYPLSRGSLTAFLLMCVALAVAGETYAASNPFPRPRELEPDVRFWVRIYTKIDTRGGLIHDSRHLNVVYDRVRFKARTSDKARSRQVKKAKARYEAILRKLAAGKRKGISKEEHRVLALWPKGVSNKTLRRAAQEVRFQLGQSDKFRAGLIRSGAWKQHIHDSLTKMGVPKELAALPHVESSFNPHAYSRIGAAGLWQFTRATGRRYLTINDVVDERMDPFAATIGAVRLLKQNRRLTGNWPLAITAYNHGTAGVRRAIRKLGTRDIATIARRYKSRTFGFASRNFYVSFLAALHVQNNAEKYFGTLEPHAPVEVEKVAVPTDLDAKTVARTLGVDLSTLKHHNLALRSVVWKGGAPIPGGYQLRVPRRELNATAKAALADIEASGTAPARASGRHYKVKRGNTLIGIATRFGVSVKALVQANGLRSRHRIRAGQKLILPASAATRSSAREEQVVTTSNRAAQGFYRVRSGDTLSSIARRLGVDESALISANDIRNRNRIRVGQQLKVASAPNTETPAPDLTLVAELNTTGRAVDAASVAVQEDSVAKIEAAEPTSSDAAPTAGPTVSASGALAADPSDYSVANDHTIEVQATETLGHYSEWLGVRARTLRKLNSMQRGKPVVIGQRLALDFSKVGPADFEHRRLAHHQTIQEQYFSQHRIEETRVHEMQRNETLWLLAQEKYNVPIWLIRQFNPDLDLDSLRPGMQVNIPLVRSRDARAGEHTTPRPRAKDLRVRHVELGRRRRGTG